MKISQSKKTWSITGITNREMEVLMSMLRFGSEFFDDDAVEAGAVLKSDARIAFRLLDKLEDA